MLVDDFRIALRTRNRRSLAAFRRVYVARQVHVLALGRLFGALVAGLAVYAAQADGRDPAEFDLT